MFLGRVVDVVGRIDVVGWCRWSRFGLIELLRLLVLVLEWFAVTALFLAVHVASGRASTELNSFRLS